jgi:hypothetical protein
MIPGLKLVEGLLVYSMAIEKKNSNTTWPKAVVLG